MKQLKPIVAAITGMFLIAGCGSMQQSQGPTYEVQPTMLTRHSVDDAEANYRLGRYHQGRIEYDKAIEAYRQATIENPGSSRAYNALGVIYAAQGKHDEAVSQFKYALLFAPGDAHLHNNLGYAYLLQGRVEEAAAAFQHALRLEPRNARAAANLAAARQKQGGAAELDVSRVPANGPAMVSPEAVRPTGTQARLVKLQPDVYQLQLPAAPAVAMAAKPVRETVLPAPVKSAPAALPAASAPPVVTAQPAVEAAPAVAAPSVASAPAAPVQPPAKLAPAAAMPAAVVASSPAQAAPPAQPVQVEPANEATLASFIPLVLKSVDASTKPAASAPPRAPAGLEISNGNGVEGMARLISRYFKRLGMSASRLTNHETFALAATRIEYRPGKAAEASAVNARLPAKVELVESSNLRWDVEVRLVLGQDMAARKPVSNALLTKL